MTCGLADLVYSKTPLKLHGLSQEDTIPSDVTVTNLAMLASPELVDRYSVQL